MSYSTLTLRTKRGQLRDHKLFSRAGPTKKAIVVGRTKTRAITATAFNGAINDKSLFASSAPKPVEEVLEDKQVAAIKVETGQTKDIITTDEVAEATLKSTPASAPDTKAAEDKSACTFFSDLPEIDYNTELGQFIASILIPHYRPVVRISKMVGDTKFEYVPVKRVRGVGKKGKNKKKNAAKRKSKKAAKAGDVQMKDVV